MALVQPEPVTPALAGDVVVFTGKLSSLDRKTASALVEEHGGTTAEDVSARTTMLVIGQAGFVGGAASSGKVRRAEELNAQNGQAIRVLTEEAFCRLLGRPTPSELTRKLYGSRDLLTRYASLRDDHLRYLVKYGIIKPALRTPADTYFAFQDLAAIKQVHEEARSYFENHGALSALRDANGSRPATALLVRTLEDRLNATLDRLFRLIGLKYPPRQIYAAYLAVNRRDGEEFTAALDFLDNVLERELKRVMIPLLDEDSVLAKRGQELFSIAPVGAVTGTVPTPVAPVNASIRCAGTSTVRGTSIDLIVERSGYTSSIRRSECHATNRQLPIWLPVNIASATTSGISPPVMPTATLSRRRAPAERSRGNRRAAPSLRRGVLQLGGQPAASGR